jgi:hypothetical protein
MLPYRQRIKRNQARWFLAALIPGRITRQEIRLAKR